MAVVCDPHEVIRDSSRRFVGLDGKAVCIDILEAFGENVCGHRRLCGSLLHFMKEDIDSPAEVHAQCLLCVLVFWCGCRLTNDITE